jgi:hypothetical protein
MNQTTNYGNILSRVRELIIDSIHTYEIDYNGKKQLYSLSWKKAKWDTMDSKLYVDNIVTTVYRMDDDIIYQHTVQMVKEIEEKLFINKKMDGDYKIVFSIVKPIVPKKAYFEAVEFVEL